VQELLARPVLEASGGTETYFHAAGREDTDALMLGRGRPFVLEVRSPRRRRFPLREIQEEVRESLVAEVLGLRRVSHGAVRAVKTAAADKTYRAWIEAASALPSDAARRSERLAGTTLEQLSPVRVMHRRGRGCLRRRKVVDSSWLGEIGGVLVWEVRVEAGTYVKELVSGDGGRTRPSLSEVLGVACRCAALDVIAVNWDPPWESAVEGETGREGAGA
jgi:tRNA pseudouridine synthase 10